MKFKAFIFLAVFSLALTNSHAHAGLKISCSMFPVYDFARAITGDSANINLILRPGTEPHEFEPSPLDVKALNDSDVFIFTGKFMEQWAEKISGTLNDTLIIDASDNISLTDNDPHVWLDLALAQKMIRNICTKLCSADSENADTFIHNAEKYCSELAELDEKFMSLSKNKTLIFAGEFSCKYFVKRYGFNYISAYDGENEPGIKRMAEIINHINAKHAKFILSDLPVQRITQSISEQTDTKILTFSTAHNVQDISKTFLQIMSENFRSLKNFIDD